MKKYFIVIVLLTTLFSESFLSKEFYNTFYLDILMTNSFDYDGNVIEPLTGSVVPFSINDEWGGDSFTLGWEFPIYNKKESFNILLGMSYTISPLVSENTSFFFLPDPPIYTSDHKIPIYSSYFKVILPVDEKLEVWTLLGACMFYPDKDNDYLTYEENGFVSALKYPSFDIGLEYGIGIDYKMENGMFAGFNFIYDITDLNGIVHTGTNTYANITGEFTLLRRSIRIGYTF